MPTTPGALVEALTEFSSRDVNLTRIESRPLRRGLGRYMFFCDLEGAIERRRRWPAAVEGLRGKAENVRVLGSYPQRRAGHPRSNPGSARSTIRATMEALADPEVAGRPAGAGGAAVRGRGPGGRVLVLNASYEPINVCTMRRATVLVLKARAEMLERGEGVIHSERLALDRPCVIRLVRYVRIPRDVHRRKITRKAVLARDAYQCQYCGANRPA